MKIFAEDWGKIAAECHHFRDWSEEISLRKVLRQVYNQMKSLIVVNGIIHELKIRHLSQCAVKKMTGPCPLRTAKRAASTISKYSLPRCWKSHKASSEPVFWILALTPFPQMPHISDTPSHLDDHLRCEPIESWDQHRAAAQQPGIPHSPEARGRICPLVTGLHLSRWRCFLLRHIEIY